MLVSPSVQRPQPHPVAGRVDTLERLPAGPALAAALADIDPAGLDGFEAVLVMRAWARQANHARGELLASVAGVLSRHDPHGRPTYTRDAYGVFEVAAALTLSRSSARDLSELAWDLASRLPRVLAALRAGELDQAKAAVFATSTLALPDDQARAVVAELLPRAPGWTVGQLRDAIARRAVALDPEWTRRRYERGLRDRRVVGRRNDDGTANLAGYQLPTDQVAAACARLDAIAHAARAQAHPERLDQLRARIFCGLTTGAYTGHTDTQILGLLLDEAYSDSFDHDPTPPEPPIDYHDWPDDWWDHGPDHADARTPGGPAAAGAGRANSGSALGRRRGGLRLWVGLGTLAGWDRRPGELLGWGPVHAELARAIAASDTCSWWCVRTGPDGTPQAIVPIRTRPTNAKPGTATGVWGEVWIQVNHRTWSTLLRRGRPDPGGGWGRVIDEITTRLATTRAGPPNGDPTARLPGQALRRWIAVRDRRCPFPGCQIPAHRGDADHSRQHAHGGATVDVNLTPPCASHHRLREHGWRLRHDPHRPGHVRWTSRLGHTYHRQPPPDLDTLPDPAPTALRDQDLDPYPYWPNSWANPPSCLDESQPPMRPPPRATADTDDETPPF